MKYDLTIDGEVERLGFVWDRELRHVWSKVPLRLTVKERSVVRPIHTEADGKQHSDGCENLADVTGRTIPGRAVRYFHGA